MTAELLYWIASNQLAHEFPAASEALAEPDGLLAVGGDLSTARLLEAYRSGIFPWYSEGQPILWWAPDPRSVLTPDTLKVSRSLQKTLNKQTFTTTFDSAFEQVISACAAPRSDYGGTWITTDMMAAYIALHEQGHAHSVECWQDGVLVGGLYGIAVGQVFFGESMFSLVTDASKVALVSLASHLRDWAYELIDCQVHNQHLASLGASTIPRESFNAMLNELCAKPPATNAWIDAS